MITLFPCLKQQSDRLCIEMRCSAAFAVRGAAFGAVPKGIGRAGCAVQHCVHCRAACQFNSGYFAVSFLRNDYQVQFHHSTHFAHKQ